MAVFGIFVLTLAVIVLGSGLLAQTQLNRRLSKSTDEFRAAVARKDEAYDNLIAALRERIAIYEQHS